jgi:hypothetical protein
MDRILEAPIPKGCEQADGPECSPRYRVKGTVLRVGSSVEEPAKDARRRYEPFAGRGNAAR